MHIACSLTILQSPDHHGNTEWSRTHTSICSNPGMCMCVLSCWVVYLGYLNNWGDQLWQGGTNFLPWTVWGDLFWGGPHTVWQDNCGSITQVNTNTLTATKLDCSTIGEIMTFDPNNVKVAAKFNNSNCPSPYTHRIVLLSTAHCTPTIWVLTTNGLPQ